MYRTLFSITMNSSSRVLSFAIHEERNKLNGMPLHCINKSESTNTINSFSRSFTPEQKFHKNSTSITIFWQANNWHDEGLSIHLQPLLYLSSYIKSKYIGLHMLYNSLGISWKCKNAHRLRLYVCTFVHRWDVQSPSE